MKANYFVTSNTATLFWDKPDEADVSTVYEIYLDGKKIGETAKTHYTLRDLNPEQKLTVEIKSSVFNDTLEIVTNKEKCKLDVTKAPYFAIGDGKTMNREILQSN